MDAHVRAVENGVLQQLWFEKFEVQGRRRASSSAQEAARLISRQITESLIKYSLGIDGLAAALHVSDAIAGQLEYRPCRLST